MQKIITNVTTKRVQKTWLLSDSGIEGINAPQNKPFAGTGNPRNEDVCLLSTLNLANRTAAKVGIKKATSGIFILYGTPTEEFNKNEYMMNPGATPKLITSANESNCAPRGEYDFNKRATNPSRKSKHAANIMNTNAPK